MESLAQDHANADGRRPTAARYGRQKVVPGKRMRAPASIRAVRGRWSVGSTTAVGMSQVALALTSRSGAP